jgi:hypothetical protein
MHTIVCSEYEDGSQRGHLHRATYRISTLARTT